MSAERTQPHPMEELLQQQVTCSQALLHSLEAERDALVERDLDTLADTTADKLRHTETLEALERRRVQLMQELGFDNDAGGIRRCLQSLPRSARLQSLWQQVLANVRACRTGNLTNGGILELGRQHVEQALSVLRGQSGSPALYGQDGDTAPRLGQRELGKA